MKFFKTIQVFAVSIAVFASCQQQLPETSGKDAISVNELVPVTFSASIVQTKVAYEETAQKNLQPDWEKDDVVIGFDENGEPYEFTVSKVEADGSATLTGSAPANCTLHLVFLGGITSASTEGLSLPYQISYDEQAGDKTIPAVMFAEGNIVFGSGDFHFHNAGAVIGINATKGVPDGSTISKITVYGDNLSAATIALASNELTLTAGGSTGESISTGDGFSATVSSDGNGTLTVNPVLIAVPAGAKVSKLGATVNGEEYFYTLSAPATLEANHYYYIERKNFTSDRPGGALGKLFSVSDTKKVYFSQGNLYWDGDSYEFEAHQYDYPTAWDANHAGHFFWVKNTETSIKPYDVSYGTPSPANSFNDIFFTNATANTANAGFTVGGVTGKYRTLSMDEWYYLLCSRTVNGGTKEDYSYSVKITYCGKTGLVIYPDDYSGSPLNEGTNYMELPEGVAFLPAAAYAADRLNFVDIGTGHYWASDANSGFFAYYRYFPDNVEDHDTNYNRSYANSVRLVVDADNPIPPIPPSPDPIDLGLSVKWGAYNLGATKPEEYGDYFMWGEVKGHTPDLTLPKNGYGIIVNAFEEDFESFDHTDARYTGNWVAANGFYSGNSPYYYGLGYTEYTYSPGDNPSGKKKLDPKDDAAHVILGNGWRMPTCAELSELFEYTDKEWTSDYEGTGVSGWIFKKKADNDKFVFLPSAGFSFDLGLSASNSQCNYWSSELYGAADPVYASSIYFDFVEVTWGQSYRYQGFPIRPVYDETLLK